MYNSTQGNKPNLLDTPNLRVADCTSAVLIMVTYPSQQANPRPTAEGAVCGLHVRQAHTMGGCTVQTTSPIGAATGRTQMH